MSNNLIAMLIAVPVALVFTLYICYLLVSAFATATPGFGATGWYIFGIMVTAVAGFLAYHWLKK